MSGLTKNQRKHLYNRLMGKYWIQYHMKIQTVKKWSAATILSGAITTLYYAADSKPIEVKLVNSKQNQLEEIATNSDTSEILGSEYLYKQPNTNELTINIDSLKNTIAYKDYEDTQPIGWNMTTAGLGLTFALLTMTLYKAFQGLKHLNTSNFWKKEFINIQK